MTGRETVTGRMERTRWFDATGYVLASVAVIVAWWARGRYVAVVANVAAESTSSAAAGILHCALAMSAGWLIS